VKNRERDRERRGCEKGAHARISSFDILLFIVEFKHLIQPIAENVSSSEFTLTFIMTIIASVFVPGRSRAVQTHFFSFCTA
jgi:hypothetical protein